MAERTCVTSVEKNPIETPPGSLLSYFRDPLYKTNTMPNSNRGNTQVDT